MLMQKRVKLRLLRTGLLLFTLDIAITLGQESLACLPKTWKQNLARYALRQKCLLHYIADNLKTSMRVQKYFPCFSQGGGELPPGSATKPCTKGVALPTGDTQTSAIALFSV